MNKKYPLILLAVASLLLYPLLAMADDFGGPWNSGVKTGDALIESRRANRLPEAKPIYNGVQGGAYFLIRFFQIVISPQDGPSCRFSPTCSAYGRQAVQKFGAFFGALMAGDRLIRCNPYNPPGSDPVPDKLR
ncbi:MAG: membrane protein insertion efficiency factor YidD [Leptospirales bacterium]|nr:membrane protein insertion efficiency factor YidD [Leptospirales bacterium]